MGATKSANSLLYFLVSFNFLCFLGSIAKTTLGNDKQNERISDCQRRKRKQLVGKPENEESGIKKTKESKTTNFAYPMKDKPKYDKP